MPAPAPAVPAVRRRPALLLLTLLLLLAAAGWAAWWWWVARHVETTDNAYVQASVVQVTPQQAGTVVEVLADDTDPVRAGQPLVRLDAADARLALERAEAQLAQAVREVRTLYTQHATLASTVAQRAAELERARSELARAQDDVARRRPLVASGAIGREELQHAEATLATARGSVQAAEAALAAARDQAATQRALTDGVALERHPGVERAAAAVREAVLALERTELTAPIDGQVVRRNVQQGQRVAAGAPLMAVVPLHRAWVEANFKEAQLRRMRDGQRVTLQADLYGPDVVYEGRINGLGAGTGAAFALLPTQNATGNWIKVVQRVPVRIALDARQLAAHPLRVGLSMHATVHLDEEPAPMPPAAAASAAAPAASAAADDEATRRIRRVVAAQLGRAARP
ncbi:MAG: HlyD family efflux transporter periplasmic adaptor subunit [Rubrivivax sp.]